MYLHDQLVHKTIIEGCTGSRNHCTGFPDALHWKSEKAALCKRNIHYRHSIIAIDNRREIYLSSRYRELCHVGQPLLIRFVSPEIPLYYIWHLRTNFSFVWTIFPCTSAFYKQPIFTHDPADHLFGENVTFAIQNSFDSAVSISFLVIVKDGRNNLAIVLVLFWKTWLLRRSGAASPAKSEP